MSQRLASLCLLLSLTACGGGDTQAATEGIDYDKYAHLADLSGRVGVDGSSTVFPVTEAVAEEFRAVAPRVQVTVGTSGTGGGFKKFMKSETDVSDASRYIKPKELEGCAAANIEFLELPVAFDGLAVVVNGGNDFVKEMTVAELAKLWRADSTAKRWSDIRSDWPDRAFKLYAPGQDSGTFDYFTEVINGASGNCRADAMFSEDDNMLVQGIAGDADGIGFFGYAYYHASRDKLNLVAIDGGDGPILPSPETIENETYKPLSRPLFIYVSTEAKQRPEVAAFVEFYLDTMSVLAPQVGHVSLPAAMVEGIKRRYAAGEVGTEADSAAEFAARYQ